MKKCPFRPVTRIERNLLAEEARKEKQELLDQATDAHDTSRTASNRDRIRSMVSAVIDFHDCIGDKCAKYDPVFRQCRG